MARARSARIGAFGGEPTPSGRNADVVCTTVMPAARALVRRWTTLSTRPSSAPAAASGAPGEVGELVVTEVAHRDPLHLADDDGGVVGRGEGGEIDGHGGSLADPVSGLGKCGSRRRRPRARGPRRTAGRGPTTPGPSPRAPRPPGRAAKAAAHREGPVGSSARGTTSSTKPRPSASAAAKRVPVRIAWSAAAFPTIRGSVCVAPPTGIMPTRASGNATVQSSADERTSQWRASSNPKPTLLPCIATIIGAGHGLQQAPHVAPQRASRMANRLGAVPNSRRSAPAEKWSPVAVNTTARTGRRRSARRAARRARRACARRTC